jgi:predicted DNA-binding protein with PD1-like motif
MRATLLHDEAEKTYALVFDKNDEFLADITEFVNREGITAAHFTAIGAFSKATLGYFERDRKTYKKIPIDEQVEVLSLIGDVAMADDKPQIHAHVVVGTAEGMARGGHILAATVWPTLEVVLTEEPVYLRKRHDPETGLALIDAGASAAAGARRAR